MSILTERRWLSAFVGLTALVHTTWLILTNIQLHRWVASAAKVGVIIDLSPDLLQQDLRIGLAFIFTAILLWSRRAAGYAILVAILTFAAIEIFLVALGPSNPFDRAEPILQIATGVILLVAALLWLRRTKVAYIALVAPLYVVVNYVLWWLVTQHIKKAAGVPILDPPTFLNNQLYGAQRWHVCLLLMTLAIAIWLLRLAAKESKSVGQG